MTSYLFHVLIKIGWISLRCLIIAYSRFVLIMPILSFFPLQNIITIAAVSSLLSVHNMLMKQSLNIHGHCVHSIKRCRSIHLNFDVSLWFSCSPIFIFLWLRADPCCHCTIICRVLFSMLTLLSCALVCRRTLRSCTMPCTWWPWLCSSLSRSLSAHYSATDTSPGALGTASWPSSKR